jgi:hypothetical protein
MSQGGGYFWDKTCSPFSLKSTTIPLYKNGFCEIKIKKDRAEWMWSYWDGFIRA